MVASWSGSVLHGMEKKTARLVAMAELCQAIES
jgi:hypothetical protein